MDRKLPNLDVLRFFLAIMVVLFHVPVTMATMGFHSDYSAPMFQKGIDAVKFFLTLSGFLIIRLLYIEKTTTHKIDIGKFYLRRVLRIYPLYYLILITGIILYHVVLPGLGIPKATYYSLPSLVAHYLLFIPNVFTVDHQVGSILNILWSIGLEEQFYLFVPLIVYATPARYFIRMLTTLLLAYLALFFTNGFLEKYSFIYFYFLFGGLISVCSLRYGLRQIFRLKLVSFLLFVLFILYFFSNLLDSNNFFWDHIIAMLLSGSFIVMISDYPRIIVNIPILNYLGRISYGIYMYHMIVLTGLLFVARYLLDLREWEGQSFMVCMLIIEIVTTCVIAHLSYRYYESYFLKMKASFRKVTVAENIGSNQKISEDANQ